MRQVQHLESNSLYSLRIRYNVVDGKVRLSLLKQNGDVLLENQQSIEIYPQTVLYSTDGREWVISDHDGRELFDRHFDFSTLPLLMGQDRYIMQNRQLFGLENLQGDSLIPCQFDAVLDWNEEYIAFENQGKACLYNRKGQQLLKAKYNNIHILGEDLFEVERKGKRALYHKDLGFITPYDQFYFTLFHAGIGGYHLQNKEWGLIDATGRRIIVPELEELEYLDHGIFVFRFEEDRWGVIDDSQKVIFPPRYQWISSLGWGYLTLSLKSRIALVDIHGKQILPFQFNQIQSLDGRNFLCRDEVGYQFYDEEGDLMFEDYFQHATPFLNGVAQIFKKEGSYLLGEDGSLLFAAELLKQPQALII